MGQSWNDLLFAHWPVEPARLRAVVPEEIPLDIHDGMCWVGVTPFEVTGLWAWPLPPLPHLSTFPEVNVRTYTTIGGKPGIWFMSLDTERRPAIAAARAAYRLPYFHAEQSMDRGDGEVRFASRRVGDATALEVRYRPTTAVRKPVPGALEHFLTERYCLYALDDRRRIHRAEIHHRPWPLQEAAAVIGRNTMAEPYGLDLAGEPLLHFARRLDVLIWSLRPVKGSGA
jgi:uncharacterized protein YqjF (DUF2071 family)